MNETFNRQQCLANINYLIKKKGEMVKNIEQAAGVSVGYLSRMNKEDASKPLSMDFLLAISEALNLSLDALVKYDFTRMSPTEEYMIRFIDKLYTQTNSNKISWEKETLMDLENVSAYSGSDGTTSHPLIFSAGLDPDKRTFDGCNYYKSYFSSDGLVYPNDNFYHATVNGFPIYITNVFRPNQNLPDYELYIVSRSEYGELTNTMFYSIEPLCSSVEANTPDLRDALKRLYDAIYLASRSVKISAFARDFIENYLTPPENS